MVETPNNRASFDISSKYKMCDFFKMFQYEKCPEHATRIIIIVRNNREGSQVLTKPQNLKNKIN